MNDELLDTKKAAQRLGMQPETLVAWRAQSRGPAFIRLNQRTIRYRLSDLIDFIEDGKRRAPDKANKHPLGDEESGQK